MRSKTFYLMKDEKGESLVGYALLLVLVALVAIPAILGTGVQSAKTLCDSVKDHSWDYEINECVPNDYAENHQGWNPPY